MIGMEISSEQGRPTGAKGQGRAVHDVGGGVGDSVVPIGIERCAAPAFDAFVPAFDDLLKHGSRSGLQRQLHRTSL